ncbi:GNAT family N-acetyltransferase [Lysobacter koreensis]|uniref:GNAT family N-acetyltransferase n=1 Tax=Lysobacter koreensis TaxID=266122 RepID=A0ABW2YP56_9GAMM
MNVEILDPLEAAAQALIARLDEHLAALYDFAINHAASVQSMELPSVRFLGAYVDGELIGCGAVRTVEGDCTYGEIKKVFVTEEHRGHGHSKAIVRELEAHLRRTGVRVARLATGIRQPEAISLYASLGYVRRPPFAAQTADSSTVYMEKQLDA